MFTEVFNNKENIGALEYFILSYFDIDIKEVKGNLKYVEKNYNNITRTVQINLNNFRCNKNNLIETYYLKNEEGEKLTEMFQIDYVDMARALDVCYNEANERERKIRRWCRALLSGTKKELEEHIGDNLMSEEVL